MELADPFRIRLARDQIAWLDSLKGGPVTTRAQALRQVLDEAIRRDQRRRPSADRKQAG